MSKETSTRKTGNENSNPIKTNGTCHEYYNPNSGVTVVARMIPGIGASEAITTIGVAKAGDHERKSRRLGNEIAHNRCKVKPYSVIQRYLTKEEFTVIAEVLDSSISMDSRFCLKGYTRLE